jgi:biopolymer transport protein ExbD
VPQKNPNPTPVEQNNDLLMVVLKTNNTIEFPARQQVSPDELSAKLASALADRPEADRTVIIAAPEKLPYNNIVNVIDVIKGAGATTIGLQIDSLEAVTQS